MLRPFAALIFAAFLPAAALADDDEGGFASAPANPVFAKECGACHMPYPAAFLPARSWSAIMDGLSDHFGEDASLAPTAVEEIRTYLTANAADAVGADGILRGVAETDTPLRITETPFWIRAHQGEVGEAAFTSPKVRSKSNCIACHRGAAAGSFEDD